MKRKVIGGKRILALTLALSLAVGQAGVAGAEPVAEADVTPAAEAAVSEEEAAAPEADETVSANEAAEEPVGADDREENETEAANAEEQQEQETGETDEEPEAETSPDGTLSKVIGLQATAVYDTYKNLTDDNGKVIGRYLFTNMQPYVYVQGKLPVDPQTGWVTYNGKTYSEDGYDYRRYSDETTLNPYYEVIVVPGNDKSIYLDAATGFYNIGGQLYRDLYEKEVNGSKVVYCFPDQDKATVLGVTEAGARAAINKAYGCYTKSLVYYDKTETDPEKLYERTPDYFDVNGVFYEGYTLQPEFRKIGDEYRYVWYVRERERIAFDKQIIELEWKSLSNPHLYTNEYEPYHSVYYEIMINGQIYDTEQHQAYDAGGALHYCSYWSNRTLGKLLLSPGESVKIQVRGVYAHKVNRQVTNEDGTAFGADSLVIDGVGPWSDELVYTAVDKSAVPVVTSVTAAKQAGDNHSILVKWNEVIQAGYYKVYAIDAKKPLAMSAAEFREYYTKDTTFLTERGLAEEDLYTYYKDSLSLPETVVTYSGEYPYHYYAVLPLSVSDEQKYYNDNSLRNIATFAAVQTAEEPKAYTPALTNFKVEKQSDGTFDLVWDRVDADVVIYALDQSSFPNMYAYKYFEDDVKRIQYKVDENGNVIYDTEGQPVVYNEVAFEDDIHTYSYYDYALNASVTNTSKDYVLYNKIRCATVDGNEGRYESLISKMGLTAGKTYYFVAHTYDSSEKFKRSDETTRTDEATGKQVTESLAKTPLVYSYPARYKDKENILQTLTVNAAYTYYPTLGPASNVVSLKAKLAKPSVYTLSGKNSVKLTLSGGLGTGYEIYRKVGKKYKKLATTTSNVYLDEGLKANKNYTYKVRSYDYNRDTKQMLYGEYRTVTAKTIAAQTLKMQALKVSKTSVKLKWTKVTGAIKYEIYRSDLKNRDTTVESKKYSVTGFKSYLNSTSYKLVKTINKAKNTSYTDKKLTAGESYTYMVVAYFKDGKTTQIYKAEDSVIMDLERPENIHAVNKGNKVVITWNADKCAAGYEIEYYVNDKYGKRTSTAPAKITTKKATLTIGGLEAGGNVSFRVRAYNKNKEYSDWDSGNYWNSSSDVPLAPVKGISAKNVTTADGRQVVKISWEPVAGAKYYKVYRSTQMGTYDADEKLYSFTGATITKECNDNFAAQDSISSLSSGYRTNDTISYSEYEQVKDSIVGTSAYDYYDFPGGVTYYYTVRAFGEIPCGGTGSYVYSAKCTKPASVTAKASFNVTATSKKGKVTLKWNKIEGATGVKYTIYRATKAKGKYTKIGTTKKNSFTDKKSKKKKTYYYKIVVTSGKSELKSDITAASPVKKVKAK